MTLIFDIFDPKTGTPATYTAACERSYKLWLFCDFFQLGARQVWRTDRRMDGQDGNAAYGKRLRHNLHYDRPARDKNSTVSISTARNVCLYSVQRARTAQIASRNLSDNRTSRPPTDWPVCRRRSHQAPADSCHTPTTFLGHTVLPMPFSQCFRKYSTRTINLIYQFARGQNWLPVRTRQKIHPKTTC